VRLFSLSTLTDKIVLVVQSRRVPTPPSTGSLVSVQCDQPLLICFGVCGRKAITKPHFIRSSPMLTHSALAVDVLWWKCKSVKRFSGASGVPEKNHARDET
jgi:hypothetical protein